MSNYNLVPFSKRQVYSADGKTVYSGYIDLDIICNSEVYIGSGYNNFVGTGKELVKETVKLCGKPVIPGSSFRGAVRAIASAVSDSCNPKVKCASGERCIVCDTFQHIHYGTKYIIQLILPWMRFLFIIPLF